MERSKGQAARQSSGAAHAQSADISHTPVHVSTPVSFAAKLPADADAVAFERYRKFWLERGIATSENPTEWARVVRSIGGCYFQ